MFTHTPQTAPPVATASENESANGESSPPSSPIEAMVSPWGSTGNLLLQVAESADQQQQTLPAPSESRAGVEPADASCSFDGSITYPSIEQQQDIRFLSIWEVRGPVRGDALNSSSAASSQRSPAAENISESAPARGAYLPAPVLSQPDTSDKAKASQGTA